MGTGDTAALYHASANSSVYHAVEPQKLDFPLEVAPAIEELCRTYPEYIRVKDFPLDDEGDKVYVAEELVNAQILMVE
jgi:lysine-specific demethylase/histidyl-hydroxylase NO66